MQRVTYDLMLDRVRELYHALTGAMLPAGDVEGKAVAATDDPQLMQQFGLLEAISRLVPGMAPRVGPFGFVPALDLIDVDGELVVELSVPGVDPATLHVEVAAGVLRVSGVRRELADGRRLVAELPRGPFRRVLPLPEEVMDEPRVEVEDGMVRIGLRKRSVGGSKAQA